jgi:RimJ/RimL family protein N-acetyltransferase
LPVLRETNELVGSCGYKGKPNEAGEVEIGYEIAATHRQKGLGTEAALALRDLAFRSAAVKKVIAHTLAEQNPSTRILQHCGMVKVGELIDPDEGPVWRWEIDRETYERLGHA